MRERCATCLFVAWAVGVVVVLCASVFGCCVAGAVEEYVSIEGWEVPPLSAEATSFETLASKVSSGCACCLACDAAAVDCLVLVTAVATHGVKAVVGCCPCAVEVALGSM